MRWAVGAGVALLFVGTSAGAAPRTDAWAVGPHPVVHVFSDDARVRVRTGPADSVVLVTKHVVKARGERFEFRPERITVERRGDTLDVEAITGGGTVVIGAVAERFEMQLVVPEGAVVRLETGEGRVDLAGVRGEFDVRTSTGDLFARDARGQLRVNAPRARRVDVRGFDGRLEVATAGDVRATGRFDLLVASTHGGDLEVECRPGCASPESWRLETLAPAGGEIVLRASPEFEATRVPASARTRVRREGGR